ncbi:MAG: serine/threonine protein kinase [Alphaproteobacteria bacterium]|nr:serine/threonine protein kinase [Alphaproteobacteria bacterium]
MIGDGGTATIYAADDLTLGVRCAVKVLKTGPELDGHLRSRLVAEAETMSRLSHPNILRVFAAGSDGADWIAMELAEGGSVADRVRGDGPLSPRRAIQVVLQVLAALDAAHSAGVVHRDVKPDNLLLQPDGSVKLADFGIALLDDSTRLTRAGFAMGSLPYMAPEQRVDASAVGPSADVYAAGATLYNLITGATPVDLFLAPPASPRFAAIPEGLVELIRKATHADPARRFANANEMADALRACLPHADDAVVSTSREPTEEYVPTELPETSRIQTDVPLDEEAHLERLEGQLHKDWVERDRERRRQSSHCIARGSIAVVITLLGVIVALGARLSMEEWLEREEVRRAAVLVPLEGTWKGTFGVYQATLELEGPNDHLRGLLIVQLGAHEMRSAVTGAVVGDALVLGEPDEAGLYTAHLAQEARLDGTYEGRGREEPFHLVRVE